VQGMPFGRYRLVELLGRGGMGEVWRAYDPVNHRHVALKLLPAHYADDQLYQERFRREAHAAAGLADPHVVPIYDSGEIEGRLFVSMKLIKGRDLEKLLEDGPLAPPRAVAIIEQISSALQEAHEVGLVHRDVKPSNIFVTENDFAYLIDFGIARRIGRTTLTPEGGVIGSPRYMAPEQFRLQDADARSDVYALACVLYECVAGHAPYPGDSFEQQYVSHVFTPPPRPSSIDPSLSRFDRIIDKGLAKNADDRYQTANELADAAHHALATALTTLTPKAADTTRSVFTVIDEPAPPPSEQTAGSPASASSRSVGPSIERPTMQRLKGRTNILLGAVAVVAMVAVVAYLLWPLSSSRQIVLFTRLGHPHGVAVDSAGSVYVADHDHSKVLELAAGSISPRELPFTDLGWPSGVAVDSGRTVYVTDSTKNKVLKLAAGSNTAEELPFIGLNLPAGVAVDSSDNVYVSDEGSLRVYELENQGGHYHPTDVSFPGLAEALGGPRGVAVDSDGNVYVTDGNRVLKLAAGATTELPFTGLDHPGGVAADSGGAVYVADWGHGRVLKLPHG
jgi:serine/threonine protein kinase, bacterial